LTNQNALNSNFDSIYWEKVLIGGKWIEIITKNKTSNFYIPNIDTTFHKIELISYDNQTDTNQLFYNTEIKDILVLKGLWNHDSVDIKLNKIDVNNCPISNSDFRWIIE